MIRLSRAMAVARRDLRVVLAGKSGVLWITAALLGGGAAYRFPTPKLPDEGPISASGQVPEVVSALPNAIVSPNGQTRFYADNGILVVDGPITLEMRAALNRAGGPVVEVYGAPRNFPVPHRGALLALLAASMLSGVLTESLPGERGRKTLATLLTAAVTPGEIALGKWLAWAGYGGASALLGATGAILLVRIEAGFWLAPMLAVPAATAALGLYLVRGSADVVGGATTTLRVIPVVLGGSALLAWVLGDMSPTLGAAVPIGGAILTAGAAWKGPFLPWIALASTGTVTALLLRGVSRALGEEIPLDARPSRWRPTVTALGLIGAAAWLPVATPSLWGMAGNPGLQDSLSVSAGLWAAHLGFAIAAALYAARGLPPLAPSAGPWRVPGLAAALAVAVPWSLPWTPSPALAPLASRLAALSALEPLGAAGVLAIATQEILFRGALLRAIGPASAVILYALILSPTDPLPALVSGAALVWLAQRSGSWIPGFGLRAIAHLIGGY